MPFVSGSYRKRPLEQGVTLISHVPRLLEVGMDAFGGNYSEGTEFDHLIVVFNEVDWQLSPHADAQRGPMDDDSPVRCSPTTYTHVIQSQSPSRNSSRSAIHGSPVSLDPVLILVGRK